jgi:hypothetical protein
MAKHDPLIAATLKKIPGSDATREQRVTWLRMIAMAMDSAYGVIPGPAIEIDKFPLLEVTGAPGNITFERALSEFGRPAPGEAALAPAAQPPKVVRVAPPPRFFIDHIGRARRNFLFGNDGKIELLAEDFVQLVNAGELDGDTIFDDRGEHGDLGTIIWADGSRGVLGKRINIAATPDMLAKAG